MTTYNTGNPLGSADPRDLYDNSENIDVLATSRTKIMHPDRLGAPRKTWHGMESDFDAAQADRERQYQRVILEYGNVPLGDYEAGIEVTGYNQTIRDCAGGTCVFYRAAVGTELPYTTTGLGMPEGGAFVDVGDGVLRSDLASFAGTDNVTYKNRSLSEKLADTPSTLDYGVSLSDVGEKNVLGNIVVTAPVQISESNVAITGYGNNSIHQEATATPLINKSTKGVKTSTGVRRVSLSQVKGATISGGTENNHFLCRLNGGQFDKVIDCHLDGQYGVSFGYGSIDLTDRRAKFNIAAMNTYSAVEGMLFQNIGSSYNAIVANTGDAINGTYHGIRLSGYSAEAGDATEAQCVGVVGAGNVLKGFSQGVYAQNASSLSNLSSMYIEGANRAIQNSGGIVGSSNPTLHRFDFTARDVGKVVLSGTASHTTYSFSADASECTERAVEEVGTPNPNGFNAYSGVLKSPAGGIAVVLKHSHNSIDLRIDEPTSGGVIIGGSYNIGQVTVKDSTLYGLSITGNYNNLKASVATTESSISGVLVSGDSNVVSVATSGVLSLRGNNNTVSGVVSGEVYNTGVNNDLSGVVGFSGRGTTTGTTNSDGEMAITLNTHPSATGIGLTVNVVNFTNNWSARIKTISSTGIATVVVFDAGGVAVADTSVVVRWSY